MICCQPQGVRSTLAFAPTSIRGPFVCGCLIILTHIPTPASFAYNDGKSSTVAGLNGWKIPELNKETLAVIAEPDSTKRLDLYKKMQQELQRSSPYVFIDQGKTQIVMRDNVQGYQQGLNADMVWFDQVTK